MKLRKVLLRCLLLFNKIKVANKTRRRDNSIKNEFLHSLPACLPTMEGFVPPFSIVADFHAIDRFKSDYNFVSDLFFLPGRSSCGKSDFFFIEN